MIKLYKFKILEYLFFAWAVSFAAAQDVHTQSPRDFDPSKFYGDGTTRANPSVPAQAVNSGTGYLQIPLFSGSNIFEQFNDFANRAFPSISATLTSSASARNQDWEFDNVFERIKNLTRGTFPSDPAPAVSSATVPEQYPPLQNDFKPAKTYEDGANTTSPLVPAPVVSSTTAQNQDLPLNNVFERIKIYTNRASSTIPAPATNSAPFPSVPARSVSSATSQNQEFEVNNVLKRLKNSTNGAFIFVPGSAANSTTARDQDSELRNIFERLKNSTNGAFIFVPGSAKADVQQQGDLNSTVLQLSRDPKNKNQDTSITMVPVMSKGDQDTNRQGCGQWNKNGVDSKTTGYLNSEAKFGEFPWMVAILKVELNNGRNLDVYVGGGSLIHPSVVLTAAHQASEDKMLRVQAGEWDTQTTNEIYPHQKRDVSKVEVHENFNKGNLFYDVAILILKSPMDLAPNVGVACLPPARERAEGGSRCFASGWGKDKFGREGVYQVILKKVELPVVEHGQCETALRKTRLGSYFELHSSFMCAGGESNVDSCYGDGGSPLVCPIQNEADRLVQTGIVAWGIGCGEGGTPGVYVDVANLREWIDDKVISNGFEPKVYTYRGSFTDIK